MIVKGRKRRWGVVGLLCACMFSNTHVAIALAPQVQISCPVQQELCGVSCVVQSDQYVLQEVHEDYVFQKNIQIARERVRQNKIREQRKKEEEARKKKERKQRKRREKIIAVCGQIVGTESEEILQRIVEAEAGGEDHKGKLLVANVVLNRVTHKAYPDTIREVVFSHRGSTYQFSPVSNGAYYRVHVSKDTKKAVRDALRGEDPSQGAMYFMERALAEKGNVTWFDRCLTKLFRHGCHEFYK